MCFVAPPKAMATKRNKRTGNVLSLPPVFLLMTTPRHGCAPTPIPVLYTAAPRAWPTHHDRAINCAPAHRFKICRPAKIPIILVIFHETASHAGRCITIHPRKTSQRPSAMFLQDKSEGFCGFHRKNTLRSFEAVRERDVMVNAVPRKSSI